tara:strand:- start:83 stop:697 length:615 start_codon:yes stop_codon:yes gene_type:complete
MKKLLGIMVLGLFLSACASNDKIVNSGKLKQNLTKSELQDVLFNSYPGDDPFIPGGGSLFINENNAEIIWGSNKNTYYVFRFVSETVSCGMVLCKLGNGGLESWHSSLKAAKASLPKKELNQTDQTNNTSITNSSTSSSSTITSTSSSGSYNSTKYAICYGEMTRAHKKRGFHKRNRVASIKVKETVCKAYAKGEINNYEGKGL